MQFTVTFTIINRVFSRDEGFLLILNIYKLYTVSLREGESRAFRSNSGTVSNNEEPILFSEFPRTPPLNPFLRSAFYLDALSPGLSLKYRLQSIKESYAELYLRK